MANFKKNKPFSIFLIDLPTFPKGVISLTFPCIAACIEDDYVVELIDLNLHDFTKQQIKCIQKDKCLFIGIKVSSQNYTYAID